MTSSKTLRRWELALLIGVALAALLGARLDGAQAALADQVIRLHVLANSDSAEDQALKLQVRDRILAEAETYLTPGITRDETEELLRAHLYDLAAAGAEIERYSRTRDALSERASELRRENAGLEELLREGWADRASVIEGLARERLGLVYPDEIDSQQYHTGG